MQNYSILAAGQAHFQVERDLKTSVGAIPEIGGHSLRMKIYLKGMPHL